MKNFYILILIIILVISCTGCRKNDNLDLQDLYEKNYELFSNHFFGWGAYKYELIFFEPENATVYETAQFGEFFSDGVEKILYVKYERVEFPTYLVGIQYKSANHAKEVYTSNMPRFIINENILALNTTVGYMLLYGEYKEVDGYWLSPDGKVLLFDRQCLERVDMVVPTGVKIIPTFSVFSTTVKNIKCNSELEILLPGAFAYFSSLEKIEFNEGLKEIWGNCIIFHNLEYVVIPESVEKIQNEAFCDVTIYCEVEAKPSGWEDGFAGDNCKVYWKGKWEYVNGVPQPITNKLK